MYPYRISRCAKSLLKDRSLFGKGRSIIPQRFDIALGKKWSLHRYAASSRIIGLGSSAFGGQNAGYDSMQVSSVVENELSMV